MCLHVGVFVLVKLYFRCLFMHAYVCCVWIYVCSCLCCIYLFMYVVCCLCIYVHVMYLWCWICVKALFHACCILVYVCVWVCLYMCLSSSNAGGGRESKAALGIDACNSCKQYNITRNAENYISLYMLLLCVV